MYAPAGIYIEIYIYQTIIYQSEYVLRGIRSTPRDYVDFRARVHETQHVHQW